ncbi:MAG: class I adenylate-forming enzyme family protein [Solirubrobacteraceae bacterium]
MPIAILRAAAREHPDRTAIATADGSVTYAALVARAEALGRGLLARGIDRFGIAVDDRIDAIALLAAAAAVGREACVYPGDLDAAGIAEHAARFAHRTVVTDASDRSAPRPGDETVAAASVGQGVEPGLPSLLTVDDLDAGAGPATPPPGTAPLLVLTTGTTGVPKGVEHEWGRLAAAVRRRPADDGHRWMLAYNLNQFGGIQVLIHALVHRGTIVVPRSSHAGDVIDALRREQVSHLSATPTFWRIVVGGLHEADAAGLALRQITLGGEPVPAPLLERIVALFPDARVTHIYGATEFGTAIAVSDGLSGLPLSILDRDEDAPIRFRVVDGELHVRSPLSVARARETGNTADDGWYASGDLVEERDGRLRFVGRSVEIINVGGAKVHPLPIEERILAVDGVDAAVVHGAPNPVTGQIVAVDVVVTDGADPDAIPRAIHAACADLPAPGRPRRIRIVDELQIRGQKVVRHRTEVPS